MMDIGKGLPKPGRTLHISKIMCWYIRHSLCLFRTAFVTPVGTTKPKIMGVGLGRNIHLNALPIWTYIGLRVPVAGP